MSEMDVRTRLRISLFGHPRVATEDGAREFALPRKTLNVLAYVILNRKHVVARDTMASALFPDDDEEAARGALRRNLSYLLSALPDGKAFLATDGDRIAWREDAPAIIDIVRFEQALVEGRDSDAVAEYAGQLLPTLYDEWTTSERERLREAFHAALGRVVDEQRARRDYDGAIATAQRLLEEDPWREDIVRQSMAIRYEAGDRAGALAAFERFAIRLRDEMQTEPLPEIYTLRDAILRGARLSAREPRPSADARMPSAEVVLPFVGRDADLATAYAAWQSAAEGHAHTLFVSGEAGVGKSRFVLELARLAEREGGVVFRGNTTAGGESQPYEAFLDALQRTKALADMHAGGAFSDDRAARLRLFESVRSTLSDLSRARPIVLILEDVHWAGLPTVDLLGHVGRRLDRAPVLIVATTRSDDLPRAHPLRALRRQMRGQRSPSEITLGRLSFADAMRAARAALPETVTEATLRTALTWIDGIPLLLAEAVRELAAGRRSNASSIAALVAERIERLSPDAETALIFGAVLGERFDAASLVATTGWRDDQILDAIAESIENGLVRATSRAPGLAFSFAHELVRVAALERIPPSDRARAHGVVARALAAQFPNNGQHAAHVARHFAAAGEAVRAATAFRSAARYALDVFANEDARESASSGLALLDAGRQRLRYELFDLLEIALARIGDTEERRAAARQLVACAESEEDAARARARRFTACEADAELRRSALVELEGYAHASPLGDRWYRRAAARDAYLRAEYTSARDLSIRAAKAFEAAGETYEAKKVRFMVIECQTRLGAFVEGRREIEALRPSIDAGEDDVLRWEFHLRAASLLYNVDRPAALEDARTSLALALRIGDRYAEARSHMTVAAAAGKMGDVQEALHENEQALAAFRAIDDVAGIRNATLNIVAERAWCGDVERALAMLDDVSDDTIPWVAIRTRLIRSWLLRRMERYDEAKACALDGRARAESAGTALNRARFDFEVALTLVAAGRLEESRPHLTAAVEQFTALRVDVLTEALAFAARCSASTGDAAAAREEAAQAAARATERRHQAHSEIAWNLAATYALLGDEASAQSYAREAAARAVEDALIMPADLAEAYLRLPWHREAIAYLWGRPVPLTFASRDGSTNRSE